MNVNDTDVTGGSHGQGTLGETILSFGFLPVRRVVILYSTKVLAIASAGGHWDELMRMRAAYEGHEVTYVTTKAGLGKRANVTPRVIPDCNRDQLFQSLRCVIALGWLMVTVRPRVVVSTGALPGLIALLMGRLIGAQTLWIDSIANGEELSLSGAKARRFAHTTVSQWPSVANDNDVEYWGAVL